MHVAHPHRPHARTVAVVRLLSALGGVRRTPGRIPRQQQPDAIRREYYQAILPVAVRPAQRVAAEVRPEVLRQLADLRRSQGKTDAGPPDDLVRRAGNRAAMAFRPAEMHAVAERFGKRTSAFQREQLDRQVRQAVGVPLSMVEKPTRDLVEMFARSNVELIKTVQDRYFDRLSAQVRDAFESGMHPSTLAERWVEVDGMAESDAYRIARDQIGKLNAQFNQERQEGMGVTGYVWRGTLDNRERDEHRDREGKHFEWDDPPDDGHPGEPIQCRCYAEPDFSAVTAAVAE